MSEKTAVPKKTALDAFAEKLLPVAVKIGTNRYLSAIRDGYIAAMPVIITASLFYLINVVVIGETGFMNQLFGLPCTELLQIGQAVIPAIFSTLGLLVCFSTAKALAEHYELDTSVAGLTAIACFFCLTPFGMTDELGQFILTKYISSVGMFTAFISALVAVEMYRFFSKFDKLIIKMPDGVPAGIARSINSIIPVSLVVIVFALIRVATNAAGAPMNDLITQWIQAPMLALVSSPVGLAIIYFFYMLLWGLGIHSAAIMNGILEPLYLINLTANQTAIAAGLPATAVMTKPFLDNVAIMGGAGNMLGLLLAIFLVSRRSDYRTIAKVGLGPALFNISEPLMFGLPVVMNPILIIPMIVTTLVSLGIGALATVTGIMGYTYVLTPPIFPPVISAFFATGGSIGAVLTCACILAVSTLIYMPFVKVMDKSAPKELLISKKEK